MSNLNPLNQTDWQNWKPRQPSPKIYSRIFGHEPEVNLAVQFRDFSRWLVPAFGCFLLALASLSTHSPARFSLTKAGTNMVLPPLTAKFSAATIPGAQQHSGVNSYPARSYEWNFGSRASTTSSAISTANAILFSYTNKLIQ